MSAPTLRVNAPHAGPLAGEGLRLRLKPADQCRGFVQGAWWPRSTQLITELPAVMAALSLRLGNIDRVIYDENDWAPAPSRIELSGYAVTLESRCDQPANTLSLIGERFGKLDLLVVPPYTNPARAYRAVVAAADPDDASTADELLDIGAYEAEDRRIARIAQQRWETEGGALRREHSGPATPARGLEVRGAQ